MKIRLTLQREILILFDFLITLSYDSYKLTSFAISKKQILAHKTAILNSINSIDFYCKTIFRYFGL